MADFGTPKTASKKPSILTVEIDRIQIATDTLDRLAERLCSAVIGLRGSFPISEQPTDPEKIHENSLIGELRASTERLERVISIVNLYVEELEQI